MQFCIIIAGAYEINLDFYHIYIIPSYTIDHSYYIYYTTLYLIKNAIYIYYWYLAVHLPNAIKTNFFFISINNI